MMEIPAPELTSLTEFSPFIFTAAIIAVLISLDLETQQYWPWLELGWEAFEKY